MAETTVTTTGSWKSVAVGLFILVAFIGLIIAVGAYFQRRRQKQVLALAKVDPSAAKAQIVADRKEFRDAMVASDVADIAGDFLGPR